MKRVLIIGCGNPLRGDDRLGWVITECLATLLTDPWVEIVQTHQLTPELAESVSRAELVVIVDASHTGRPGSWKLEEIELIKIASGKLGHHFTPSSLLAYASVLYQATPRMLALSVSGGSFDCSESLTPEVEEALPAVIRTICDSCIGTDVAATEGTFG